MTDDEKPHEQPSPGERLWYDRTRRCLTVIRQDGPTSWAFVREATPEDKTLPYYGAVRR